MKRLVNVLMTFIVIVIIKGCVIAPLYLTVSHFTTWWAWGHDRCNLWLATRFEYKRVWRTLCSDFRDGCNAFIFNLNKSKK